MIRALSGPSSGTKRFLVPVSDARDVELPAYAIVVAMGTPGVIV
jgi:hypothetical protein